MVTIIMLFGWAAGVQAAFQNTCQSGCNSADEAQRLVAASDSAVICCSPDSVAPHVHRNKKAIAAILAFPFPFGILGLHRIYLGTKPYMPYVYVGTLGGCFGILPLIDFVAILSSSRKNLEGFKGNPRVFMWVH